MNILISLWILINLFQYNQESRKVEIYFKDGKIIQYDEIGRNSRRSGKLTHTFRVQYKQTNSHLQFEKVIEIDFGKIKENNISVDVLLSSGSIKKFELIRDSFLCRTGDKIVTLSLESVRKIKFIKS